MFYYNPVQVNKNYCYNDTLLIGLVQSYINYGLAVTVSIHVLFNSSIEHFFSYLPCKTALKRLGCVPTYDPRTGMRNSIRSMSIMGGPRSMLKLESEGRALHYRVDRDAHSNRPRHDVFKVPDHPMNANAQLTVADDVKAAACVSVDGDASQQIKRAFWLKT